MNFIRNILSYKFLLLSVVLMTGIFFNYSFLSIHNCNGTQTIWVTRLCISKPKEKSCNILQEAAEKSNAQRNDHESFLQKRNTTPVSSVLINHSCFINRFLSPKINTEKRNIFPSFKVKYYT